MTLHPSSSSFFFFNDTATTEIYTLSLHDALPISIVCMSCGFPPNGMAQEHRTGCDFETNERTNHPQGIKDIERMKGECRASGIEVTPGEHVVLQTPPR